MEYRRSKYLGDHSIDEVYEGTPEEISKLVMLLPQESKVGMSDLVYDTDDATEFIQLNFASEGKAEVTKGVIKRILEIEEDYMRSVGIIED